MSVAVLTTTEEENRMSMTATTIARSHLESALSDAKSHGFDTDPLCRAMLALIVSKYLEYRTVRDVQSELQFLADNCDPERDFEFMRP
jgi:hypothetical protein